MTVHGAHPQTRRRHRSRHHPPIPNWLKVFYVVMIFLAYVFALSLALHH